MTPARVELLGVPGTGKSTFYDALLKGTPFRARAWRSEGEALRDAARAACGGHSSLPGGLLRRAALRIPALVSMMVTETMHSAPGKAAFAAYVRRHGAFLESVTRLVASATGTRFVKPEGHYHLFMAMRRDAFLETWHDGAPVIGHETLGHILLGHVPDAGSGELAEECFRRLPLPRAVVLLEAPSEVVVSRLRHRQHGEHSGLLNVMHGDCTDFELQEFVARKRDAVRRATGILEQRGVPVLRLDAMRPPDGNAPLARRFLDDLNGAG